MSDLDPAGAEDGDPAGAGESGVSGVSGVSGEDGASGADRASGEDDLEATEEDEGRRYPRTIGGMFYLVVLAGAAVGIGITWTGNWRAGTDWLAGALIFAALIRLVLPRREAGMLAVRHRVLDCLLLAVVGGILIFLAATIPNQPL